MTHQEFIEQIAYYVQKYATKYGISVCSPIIAQACLESAYGTSKKAKYHNYFGLKYRGSRVSCASGSFVDGGSEQNKDGSYVSSDMTWYKFDTMEKGVEGYFQFINIPNYANVKGVTNPRTYLENLKKDGYATSLKYVDNVMNTITSNNLTKYDTIKGGNNTMSFKVALDAGHGSNTSGKRSPDGYREHWNNTHICYYLDQILRANGIQTYKSSWNDSNAKDDTDIEMSLRQSKIKAAKCDISVSVHANAFGNGWNTANGIETYYNSNNTYAKDSAKLASLVHNQLIKGTVQTNRGVKRAAFAMCNCVALGTKAAILIETAFMTNQRESALLKSDAYMRECAREIAQGIFDYFGVNGNINVTLASISENTTSTVVSDGTTTKPVTPTPVKPTNTTTNVTLKAGAKVNLSNVTFYASATAKTGNKKSGTYYIWSAEKVNNRVRMTNSASNVSKSGQVTGWVNVSDLNITSSGTSVQNNNKTTSTVTSRKYVSGGIDYGKVFDPAYYATKYADLVKVFGNNASKLFNHFLTYGMKEGRQGIGSFNVVVYKANNLDLVKAFGNNLPKYYQHYIQFGYKENRKHV